MGELRLLAAPEAARMMAGDPQVKPTILQRQANARAKRREVEFSSDVRAEIRARAGGCCEVCRMSKIDHYHHKLMRSHGGKGTVANGLAVCGSCHAIIHTHPYLSYTLGYLVRAS